MINPISLCISSLPDTTKAKRDKTQDNKDFQLCGDSDETRD